MTVRLHTRNVTGVFRQATASEREEGKAWYETARAFALTLDPSDPGRAAAIIAALSPRLEWGRNMRAAEDVYAGRAPKVLGLNADKANRILAGEDPGSVLKGPKVTAFWYAITDPSDRRAIVIDRHAFDVAAGKSLTDPVRTVLLSRVGVYDKACETYVRAARIVSRELGEVWTPPEVQAAAWVTWRRLKRGV